MELSLTPVSSDIWVGARFGEIESLNLGWVSYPDSDVYFITENLKDFLTTKTKSSSKN